MKKLKKDNFERILCGDYNVDFSKSGKNVEKFQNFLNKNSLIPINIIENLNKNLI